MHRVVVEVLDVARGLRAFHVLTPEHATTNAALVAIAANP
jgi:hypothetical protein